MDESVIERFWPKVDKRGPDDCWPWLASTFVSGVGYGQFKLDGRPRVAHRVSFEIANGPIPDGQIVRHKCDNPPCVNPAHLELGTHKDNMRDALERGRWRGGAHFRARTHCPQRHEYTPDNTIIRPRRNSLGEETYARFCRECKRLDQQERDNRKRRSRNG